MKKTLIPITNPMRYLESFLIKELRILEEGPVRESVALP